MINCLNATADIGGFKEQGNTIGPIAKFDIAKGWKAEAVYLAGLSDDTSDHTVRLWKKYRLP